MLRNDVGSFQLIKLLRNHSLQTMVFTVDDDFSFIKESSIDTSPELGPSDHWGLVDIAAMKNTLRTLDLKTYSARFPANAFGDPQNLNLQM